MHSEILNKSGFTLDFHALGNTGNSEIAEGMSIAPFRPGRAHFKIQQNNLFSFEFVVNTWVPDLGRRMSINFEDNSIVTEKGVEFLYPVNKENYNYTVTSNLRSGKFVKLII